jgi:hypothetical protein
MRFEADAAVPDLSGKLRTVRLKWMIGWAVGRNQHFAANKLGGEGYESRGREDGKNRRTQGTFRFQPFAACAVDVAGESGERDARRLDRPQLTWWLEVPA